MWFEAMLELKINLEKSEMILVRKVDNLEYLACEIWCKVGKLSSSYLGLLLEVSYKFVAVWDRVEEWFHMRLLLWKRQGGRLTLLLSTLTSVPIYFISMFTIPRIVKLRLEKI